jgi:putative ABC transport system permease protein
VNGLDLPIVGVVPSTFVGTGPDISVFATNLWLPDSAQDVLYPDSAKRRHDRADRRLKILMRAHLGVTLAEARNSVEALGRDLERAYPDATRDRRMTVDYEETMRRKPFVMISALSLSVAGLVLLIACANVAGLLLGRSEARRQEIAVRLAMGASRGRLVRQVLVESALLSVMGAAAGLLLAACVGRLATALTPASPIPVTLDLRLDVRLFAFTLIAACVAVPAFGLTPALLAARRDVFPILKGSADASRAGGFRTGLRGALVAGQVALSLALVVASGLLVRSYLNTTNSDIGFARRPMVFGILAPPVAGYTATQTQQFFGQLLERLNGTPGVTATALAAHIPLNGLIGGGAMEQVVVPGQEPPAGQPAFAIRRNVVSAGYFNAMGVPLLRGRDFALSDRRDSMRVAIINQTMAKRFWPNAEAVGQHISLMPDANSGSATDCEVIGVARDSKYVSINEPAEPYLYLAYAQTRHGEMSVIVRGQNESTLSATLRSAIADIGPSVPVSQLTTLTEHLHLAMIGERVLAGLVTGVGAIALFLSVIGLYGVVAFAVARRTREIAIRIALGATRTQVIGEVLKQGGRFAAAGTVVGLLLAAAVGRVLSSGLYGVSGSDPLTFAGSVVAIGLVVMAASYVPARRAVRIDPIAALRCE